MATGIVYKGKRRTRPDVYTTVDSTGLARVSPLSRGAVAILATSENGRPVSSITDVEDVPSYTDMTQVLRAQRRGDFREAAAFVFRPERNVARGAQRVYQLRVDQATQSSATFSAPQGTTLLAKSDDYGVPFNGLSMSVATGSVTGKQATVAFEGDSDTYDNLSFGDMFSLSYAPPAGSGGWEAMKAQVLSTGIRCWGTRTDTGLATSVTNPHTAGARVQIVCSSASDAGKVVSVFGLDGSGNPQREDIIAGGLTTVVGTKLWGANGVLGAKVNSAAVGTITVQDNSDNDAIVQIGIAGTAIAMTTVSGMFVGNDRPSLNVDSAVAGNSPVILVGKDGNGVELLATVTLTVAMGTLPQRLASAFSEITDIVLGGLANARTLTVAALAVDCPLADYPTLAAAKQFFDGRKLSSTTGFLFTLITGRRQFLLADLDLSTAEVDVYNVVAPFTALLAAFIEGVNLGSETVTLSRIAFAARRFSVAITPDNSQAFALTFAGSYVATYTSDASATAAEIAAGLVLAANANTEIRRRATVVQDGNNVIVTSLYPVSMSLSGTAGGAGALVITQTQALAGVGQPPSNTVGPVPFVGGSSTAPTTSDWQAAFDLCKQLDLDVIVPISADPIVHAIGRAHLLEMDGVNERTMKVGLLELDGNDQPIPGTLPSVASFKAQIVDLADYRIQAAVEGFTELNTFNVLTTFDSRFAAAVEAGLEVGLPLGQSQVNRVVRMRSVQTAADWNPREDADEVLDLGATVFESRTNTGVVVVRGVTTYLEDQETVEFIEASSVAALVWSVKFIRQTLRDVIPDPSTLTSLEIAKNSMIDALDRAVREGALLGYPAESLALTLDGEVLVLDVAVYVATNILFVLPTIRLARPDPITV